MKQDLGKSKVPLSSYAHFWKSTARYSFSAGSEAAQHNVLVDIIVQKVEIGGNIAGRFRLFDTFHENSELYQQVTQPLISMRIVGSITMERMTNNIKWNVLTNKRNGFSDPKTIVYMRASINLEHIVHTKKGYWQELHKVSS